MKNYNENIPDSYIMHYDINSMYGYIMLRHKLHYDLFTYLTDKEL